MSAVVSQRPSRAITVPILMFASLIVLGAFAIRLIDITKPALGMDGGLSLALAALSPTETIDISMHDVHPPLYYLLLHYWMHFAGTSPLAAKYLSAGMSLLTVVGVFVLGRRLGGIRLALIAAALMAVSPIAIVNSTAVRDFTAGALFAVLATYAFVVLLDTESAGKPVRIWPWWIAFILFNAAGLAISYLNLAVLAAQMVYALAFTPSWRLRGRWLLAGIGTAILYTPWIWIALRSMIEKMVGQQVQRESTGGMADPLRFVADALHHLAVDEFATFDPVPIEVGYVVIFVGGLAMWWIACRRHWSMGRPLFRHGWFLALTIAFLLALAYGIVQVWLRLPLPPRYLVVTVPFAMLLLAQAMDALAGRQWVVSALLVAAFTAAAGFALRDYYACPPPPLTMWNPQGMTEYLDTKTKQGDGIVFFTLEQAGYYESLSRNPLPWQYFLTGLGYQERDLIDRIDRFLPTHATNHDALWLMRFQNWEGTSPQRVIDWLNKNAYASGQEQLTDTLVIRYVTGLREPTRSPVAANFGNAIELKEYGALPVAPNDLKVVLVWQAIGPVTEDYTVFVHLVDDGGKLWAQRDCRPENNAQATSTWQPGRIVEDKRGIALPADMPSGRYWLDVGLYAGDTRLDVTTGGNSVRLGPVDITR